MPIRTASFTRRLEANGQALHRAMMKRQAQGADAAPTEGETALIEERRQLKEERDKRKAQASGPKPTAVDRLLRTHHAQAKDKPKVKKETQEAKGAKPAKPHKSRAEKHAAKAAALDAARRAPKKPAK